MPRFDQTADREPVFLPAFPLERVMRLVRAARRLALVAIWACIGCCLQSVLIRLPGRAKVDFARAFWAVICRLMGLRIRLVGAPASGSRPVIYASNHSSWLDILVLGARLRACFVAKADVALWPVMGTIARLGRTVFVSRTRARTGAERDDMRARLDGGDALILFPEGTSSDGSRVLRFHSSFFAAAEPGAAAAGPLPLVQPVSVVFDRLCGLPLGRAGRPIFAWYGDMDLAPHLWRLAQWRGMRASIVLHAPLDPADFASRKALAEACWRVVADGAAVLRQNRAAAPIATAVAPPEAMPADPAQPAFA